MNPSVRCICLTADRQMYTDRAVESFLAQTYRQATLLIYDTGLVPYEPPPRRASNVVIVREEGLRGQPIGSLRNRAIDLSSNADMIAHWDSDDWSGPERIEWQVEALKRRDTWLTGFRNMLFYRHSDEKVMEYDASRSGIGKSPGTSFLYLREAWEAKRFPDVHTGEDTQWAREFRMWEVDGVLPEPLLIAEVHSSNTSGVYSVFDNHQPAFQPEWRLAPEWRAYARERMYGQWAQ